MYNGANALEGLKLINDWSKWLIAIETGAIAIIGSVIKDVTIALPYTAKILSTVSIVCFLISIAVAAILLLSLPEIAQTIEPNRNIWTTRDSVIGQMFHMDTQGFAVL